MRDNRRMHEGARDLAIAFNVGRAEEALHRVKSGAALETADLAYFSRIADLFLDALDAYQWIEQTVQGSSEKVGSDALRVFQLLLPVVRETTTNQALPTVFSELAETAKGIREGQKIAADHWGRFEDTLRRLGTVARRQGIDALETKPPTALFPQLPKLA